MQGWLAFEQVWESGSPSVSCSSQCFHWSHIPLAAPQSFLLGRGCPLLGHGFCVAWGYLSPISTSRVQNQQKFILITVLSPQAPNVQYFNTHPSKKKVIFPLKKSTSQTWKVYYFSIWCFSLVLSTKAKIKWDINSSYYSLFSFAIIVKIYQTTSFE